MITCIMQPTYLPWIGYFAILKNCQQFIILDNVQFNKRSWQQRNNIKSQGKEITLTVPVISKNKQYQKINEVLIDSSRNFRDKHVKSLSVNYSKSKYFNQIQKDLFYIINYPYKKLIDLNVSLIKYFINYLDLNIDINYSSSYKTDNSKDQLIFELCKLSNTNEYFTPIGSKAYLNENTLEKFYKNNIKVNFFNYNVKEYNQLNGNFISSLSIVDLIFNEGKNSTKYLNT